MSGTIVTLIIQIIAGAVGGNAAGAAMKDFNLGTVGNTIAGAIGGGGGGLVLAHLIPALASGNMDIGSIVGQVVGGGAAGAILTGIVGLVKNKMA
jgi:hypothetical protein